MKNRTFEANLVSIIIPTYNHEKYVVESITSALLQTYKNIEVIVSDDCSTDNTQHVLKSSFGLSSKVKLILGSENVGISKNFNKLFEACNGEFVAFLGGDDIMLPEKIEKQVKILQQNPNYVLTHHDAYWWDLEKKQIIKKNSDLGKPVLHPLDWAFHIDWYFNNKTAGVLPSTCLARSSYYLTARYDERLKFKHELLFTVEDYYQNPAGEWHYLDESLTKYGIHSNNFSKNEKNVRLINEESFKLCDLALEKCPDLKLRIDEYRSFFIFHRLIFNWFDKEDRKKYRKEFFLNSKFDKKELFFTFVLCIKLNLFWPIINLKNKINTLIKGHL